MRAYSFADDRYAPRPAVEALLRRYSAARIDRRHLGDTELRGRRVGHFGFFRAGLVPDLWQEADDWLTSGGRVSRY
jgi:predicted alpha/beta hydrolase